MQYKYFVYNQEGLVKKLRWLYGNSSLTSFIVQCGGPWKFGNSFKDKRLAYRDCTSSGCGFFQQGHEPVEYMIYELIDGEEVLFTVSSINKLFIELYWHKTMLLARDERPRFLQNRRCLGDNFRKGPVPGTGKHHFHFADYYRSPKITSEKRWNEAHEEYVRPKRRPAALPDARDDVPRRNSFNKYSWKKQKKRKQWM